MKIFVIVLVIISALSGVHSDLKLSGVKCGMVQCQPHQFCSDFDKTCSDCSNICNPTTHNYEEKKCVQDCQVYLHDLRYVRSGIGSSNPGIDLAGDIQKLYKLVTAALTLVILVIVALLTYMTYNIYKWVKQNDITLSNCKDYFTKNIESNEIKTPNNGQATGKIDLRLEMPPSGNQSELSPVTMTTSISRRPAEDSALDYAYDNHAMSGTPSPQSAKTAKESNF